MNNNYKKVLPTDEFNYELFKLQWLKDHNLTLLDLIRELDEMKEDCPELSLMELFECWEADVGFSSMIYPCFDEWYETERKEQ